MQEIDSLDSGIYQHQETLENQEIQKKQEIQTFLSGISNSFFSLGSFIGPTLSGVFIDLLGGSTTGFAYNSVILQGLLVVTTMLHLVALRGG